MFAPEHSYRLRRMVLLIALIVAVAVAFSVLRRLASPARSATMLKSIDAISHGVTIYAGTNGGQIPAQHDLLAALTARGAAPDNDPMKLGGYAIKSVERIDAERYRIRVTCPATKDGRAGCGEILRARSPRTSTNITAVSGHGGASITIDFRL